MILALLRQLTGAAGIPEEDIIVYDASRPIQNWVYNPCRGDDPAGADYDGDGAREFGIFRPATGLWAIRGVTRRYFGGSIDSPVPADSNGDGTDDIGIFRPLTGMWAIRGVTRTYFGDSGDLPLSR